MKKNALCLTLKEGEKVYLKDIEVIFKEIRSKNTARIVFIVPEDIIVVRDPIKTKKEEVLLDCRSIDWGDGS